MADTTAEQVIARVRAIIQKRLRAGVEVPDDAPLYSSGMLDSMSIVDLLMELESTFDIAIPGSEVQTSDLDSVKSIADTVIRFRSGSG